MIQLWVVSSYLQEGDSKTPILNKYDLEPEYRNTYYNIFVEYRNPSYLKTTSINISL